MLAQRACKQGATGEAQDERGKPKGRDEATRGEIVGKLRVGSSID
jgi:hypothetical protein